jgi:hypothetical protein
MKSCEASAAIDPTPEAVWSILVDGGSYTDWDSGVVRDAPRLDARSGSVL